MLLTSKFSLSPFLDATEHVTVAVGEERWTRCYRETAASWHRVAAIVPRQLLLLLLVVHSRLFGIGTTFIAGSDRALGLLPDVTFLEE